METTTAIGGPLVGGVLDFPVESSPVQPVPIVKEQINAVTTVTTSLAVPGNVINQLTGVFVNGVNTLYPLQSPSEPANQSQGNIVGVLGGNSISPGNGPGAFAGGFTGTIGG